MWRHPASAKIAVLAAVLAVGLGSVIWSATKDRKTERARVFAENFPGAMFEFSEAKLQSLPRVSDGPNRRKGKSQAAESGADHFVDVLPAAMTAQTANDVANLLILTYRREPAGVRMNAFVVDWKRRVITAETNWFRPTERQTRIRRRGGLSRVRKYYAYERPEAEEAATWFCGLPVK